MFDLSISNVFALGALCERVIPEPKPEVRRPLTSLDKIDLILSKGKHKEKHNEIVSLIKAVTDGAMKIIERNGGFSYHNDLMAYLGQGTHTMTYSYYRGLLSLNAHLRRSDVKLLIERFADKPDRTSFSATSRRKAVLVSSVNVPRIDVPAVREEVVTFTPVEYGDSNPFEVDRGDLRSNDFGGRTIPSLTYFNRIPVFRRMEINYIDQIHDKFLIGGPIKRTVFGAALELDYKNGMTQVFSVMYFWGLIRSVGGNLYFNEPIIRQVVTLLRSIDYVGVITAGNTEVLASLERLVMDKQVLRRNLSQATQEECEKHKLIVFKDEGLNEFRSYFVGYITPHGRKVYSTWLEIQKICEPYARQAQQRIKD